MDGKRFFYRHYNYRFVHFLSTILFVSFIHAQQSIHTPEQSLLWEIKGKGIKEPGYLFGTIHLKDSRVFNFYDSLLPKINACKQFAIEIDPDTLVRGTFKMETQEDSVIDLREGNNGKEIKDIEEQLEDELGFSLHRLNRKNLRALKRYFSSEAAKPDDKPTFLDAWLCDFARRTGKQIKGLETFEGHMEAFETLKEGGIGKLNWDEILSGKSKSLLENMVSTYLANDPVAIEQMYASTAGEGELASLRKRNHAMANSIDSLLKNGSLFSAVGSAHLAGQEGVINLLRKKGYTVTAINPVRSGYHKKLKHEYFDDSWKRINFPEFGYSAVFPSAPFKIERENSLMYTWTDIGSGINYFSMANFLSDKTNAFVAELSLRMIAEGLKKSDKVKVKASNVYTTDSITQLWIDVDAGENRVSKMRYLIKDNMLYSLFAEYHKNNEHPEDIERFLNSWKSIERKEMEWKTFSSKTGAFEIYIPPDPKEKVVKTRQDGADFETHFYTVFDPSSSGTFLFRYFDLPAGYSYSNDSVVLKVFSDDLLDSQGKALNNKEESLNRFLGFPSYDIYAQFDDYTAVKIRTVLRGGRIYNLMFSASKEKLEKMNTETFFGSLDMKPFLPAKLKAAQLPADTNYRFMSPGELSLARGDSVNKENIRSTYAAADAASGTSYFFSAKDLAPYYYAKNDSVFFSDADKLFLSADDSIIFSKNQISNNKKQREFHCASKNCALIKKVKYFNSGRRIYAVIVMQNEKEQDNGSREKIFNSVVYSGKEQAFDFKTSKTRELLDALISADTVVQRQAKIFLKDYNFESTDLSMLKDALQKRYTDDELKENSTLALLLQATARIADERSAEAIVASLPLLQQNADLSACAWRALLKVKSKKSAAEILLALEKNSISKKIAAREFSAMTENTEAAALLFPEVLKHISKEENWGSLYSLFALLEEKGTVKKEIISPYAEKIFGNLNYLSENDPDFVTPANFIEWMRKNDASNPYLLDYYDKMQRARNPQAKLEGLSFVLQSNGMPDKKCIEDLAALKEYRLNVYELLEQKNKEQMFPKKYSTQAMFSESDLTEWLKKNEFAYDKFEFQKEVIFDYTGFKQKMFVYKLTYTRDGEQKVTTAYSGPFPPKADYLIKKGDFTGTSKQEYFPDMFDILIRQHIKKLNGF